MGGFHRTPSQKMMKVSLVLAAFVAGAMASYDDETPAVACVLSNSVKTMFTSGAGSSVCTLENGAYYKGVCNNGLGTYAVTKYSDSSCTTVDTGYGTDGTQTSAAMPATFTPPGLSAMNLLSCGKCPPEHSDDSTFSFIGGFFGIVFGYLMVVCAGMYIAYSLGASCEPKCEWMKMIPGCGGH